MYGVNWRRLIPSDFEYDFERDELAAHGVTFEEAVEWPAFFRDFEHICSSRKAADGEPTSQISSDSFDDVRTPWSPNLEQSSL